MSDADALKKAIFRLSFNVCVTQFVTLKFQEKYRHCTRGDREGVYPGSPPWYRSQMPNVLNGIELAFTSCLPASSARACSSVLSLLNLLHLRCVSLQLVKLYGSPPRETGTSSSTSALIGCGVFNVLSTGLPQMAHTSYAARTLALSCLRRQPLLTRSLRRLLMWPPHMYEPRGAVDLPTTIFAVGLLECRYRGSRIWTLPCLVGAPHHLRIPLPRVCFMGAFGGIRTRVHTRPQGRESNKKTRGRYDLPLIPTKAYRQADLSITASRKHGIGLPATLGYAHSDGSGRSVSDMPFGQDGTATQGVRRIHGGYEKGSNQVTSV